VVPKEAFGGLPALLLAVVEVQDGKHDALGRNNHLAQPQVGFSELPAFRFETMLPVDLMDFVPTILETTQHLDLQIQEM
jgi:hypothetical protein